MVCTARALKGAPVVIRLVSRFNRDKEYRDAASRASPRTKRSLFSSKAASLRHRYSPTNSKLVPGSEAVEAVSSHRSIGSLYDGLTFVCPWCNSKNFAGADSRLKKQGDLWATAHAASSLAYLRSFLLARQSSRFFTSGNCCWKSGALRQVMECQSERKSDANSN